MPALRRGLFEPFLSSPLPASVSASLLGALLCLLLWPRAAEAQDSISISGSLSGSISDPIYSESNQAGPSSSLVQGDTNLLTPYTRTGISDPLGFLIESSFMSPYGLGVDLVNGYVLDAYVQTQVVNDSTLAARFSEYRDNRNLMSGAGGRSTPGGRIAAAGSPVSRSLGTTMNSAASAALANITVRAPFAAGSSVLAARQSALSGMDNFVDPNAQLVVFSSTSLGGMEGSETGSGGAPDISTAGSGVSDGASAATGPTAGASAAGYALIAESMLVPPVTSNPMGAQPGSVFADTSFAAPTLTGFQDSTMGTAGLPYQVEDTGLSPLSSPNAGSSASPFRATSEEDAHYLSPTLIVGAGDAGAESQTPQSMSELTRKARMHAMIYNPSGSPMPSPFQQRALQKEYLRKKNERHVSRYPSTTAPSVTP